MRTVIVPSATIALPPPASEIATVRRSQRRRRSTSSPTSQASGPNTHVSAAT
jgi:hypothetical protein